MITGSTTKSPKRSSIIQRSFSYQTTNFSVTNDFNLGNFIKNEKTGAGTVDILFRNNDSNISASSDALVLRPRSSNESLIYRVKAVDEHVKYKYWSFDDEYLLSCIVPVIWSFCGLFFLFGFELNQCIYRRQVIFSMSCVWFIMNIAEVTTLWALRFAKRTPLWTKKISIVNGVILIKLFVTTANFFWMFVCLFVEPCGYSFRVKNENSYHYFEDSHRDANSVILAGFVRIMRFYDLRFLALCHSFASMAQLVSAMLLAIKRNDIKMYSLWRMGKLDQYLQDLQNMH